MKRYLIGRLFHSMFVVVAVVTVVFVLIRLTGDPVVLFLPVDATPEQIAAMRHELGFDRPVAVQFLDFMARAIRGDFGESLRHGEPALTLVVERIPATLQLTLVALVLMLLVALPIGVLSAVRKQSAYDVVGMALAMLGQSVPTFWLGIVLVLVFAVKLRWLPSFGRGSVLHLILPGVTLGAYSAAITTRLVRSAILETLGTDYIRTARAKGLSERVVLYKHALRNASIPIITVVGLQVGTLMGGAIVTEQVFSYPGMGRLAVQAIGNRDIAVVQAFVVVTAVIILVTNLLVDVAYAIADPRVRLE